MSTIATVLYWIGILALLVVVAPMIVTAANSVLSKINAIDKMADTIIQNAGGISQKLQAIPKLVQTKSLTSAARGLVGRYGAALLRAL
jgi:predicted PurR-regulated permease PerM